MTIMQLDDVNRGLDIRDKAEALARELSQPQ
jgi:hypothetical protein